MAVNSSFSSIGIHATIIQYAIAVLSNKIPSTYGSTIQRGVQYSMKNPINKTNSKYTTVSVESNSILVQELLAFVITIKDNMTMAVNLIKHRFFHSKEPVFSTKNHRKTYENILCAFESNVTCLMKCFIQSLF